MYRPNTKKKKAIPQKRGAAVQRVAQDPATTKRRATHTTTNTQHNSDTVSHPGFRHSYTADTAATIMFDTVF